MSKKIKFSPHAYFSYKYYKNIRVTKNKWKLKILGDCRSKMVKTTAKEMFTSFWSCKTIIAKMLLLTYFKN